MRGSRRLRRGLAWGVAAFAALLVIILVLLVALEAGHGRALVARVVEARTGREIHINGALRAHLFSRTPEVVAEQVTIGNPPWMPAGLTAQVAKLTMVLKLPGFDHPAGVVRLDMEGATLHLVRAADGRANWQLIDPARTPAHSNSPILRSVSVPDAHVELADDRRHLQFVGTVSASAPDEPGPPQPARIVGAGELNGRAATFELTGDPLPTAHHWIPYRFTFSERSSGSRVEGRGALPEPFDFKKLDASFETEGPDLRDLFFLTGVHLIDTGAYHLSGTLSRRGVRTEYHGLQVTSGLSDMHGDVAVENVNGARTLDLDLASKRLKLSDLGLRAAGRAPQPQPQGQTELPNTRISLALLRFGTVSAKFHADEVDAGPLPLHKLSAAAGIRGGVLSVAPLSADVLGGKASARVTLDGRQEIPSAALDLRITDLQVGQLPYKDPAHPPIEGPLRVRVIASGAGQSVRKIAASIRGTVSAQIRSGAIRASLAELTGLDLHGLGLLLLKDQGETPLHCAVARLKAQDGTLVVENLVADTDPVLITGEGRIHLDLQTIDLQIHGSPKHVRLLRLRAPVLVQGALAHPAIHIGKDERTLVVVDPGNAADADCAALLEEPGLR